MSNLAEEQDKPKRGNPSFYPGMPALNPSGRPKKILDKEKRTNRSARADEFLMLVRKFRPHLTKAVQAAVGILDNKEANDQNKLRASALIISTYKDLISSLYDKAYDEEEAQDIQNNTPIVSFKVINNDNLD